LGIGLPFEHLFRAIVWATECKSRAGCGRLPYL
jgi:hypothetical protein